MAAIKLLRSQKNQVFTAIRDVGLDPSDFQWSEEKSIWNNRVLRITHRPMDFYFDFASNSSGIWEIRFWPTPSKAELTYPGAFHDWEDVFAYFETWVATVRSEYEEPDLWEVSQQEKKLIAEQIDDLDNSPFSAAEGLRISAAVKELREFLITSSVHSESQSQFITTRLQHLEDASHRLGRKDWITLAMGTLTNIVVGTALAPEAARELLRTAGSLLGWVVGTMHLLP